MTKVLKKQHISIDFNTHKFTYTVPPKTPECKSFVEHSTFKKK